MSDVEKLLKQYADGVKGANAAEKKVEEARLRAGLNAFYQKWKGSNEKTAKKLEKEQKKKEEHAASAGECTAVLWRNDKYNVNCYEYMKTREKRKKEYKMTGRRAKLSSLYQYPAAVNIFMKNFGIDQRDENFNTRANLSASQKKVKKIKGKSGCSFPYKWEGHHMIPCGAFYQKLKNSSGSGSVLTDDQYAILLLSDYDVNHGQNVIPLPKQAWYMGVHEKPYHSGNHDEYTNLVQKGIKQLSQRLEKIVAEADKPHPDIKVDVTNELASLEDRLWRLLNTKGKQIANAAMGSYFPDNNYLSDQGKLV